jgi:hypothetical protein
MIATYAALACAHGPVTIISTDKDMMQLVCDQSQVRLYLPEKTLFLGEAEVQTHFGVGPALVPHVQVHTLCIHCAYIVHTLCIQCTSMELWSGCELCSLLAHVISRHWPVIKPIILPV